MKKVFLLTAVLIMSLAVFSQQITQESLVINIEVPVRVYKGNAFVDNLNIDDFEILEEGIPQKIEAVYLVKKKSIERKEEKRKFSPEISRNFFLFFEISEYTSKLGDAISYFIHNKVISGDNIIFVTPVRTYRMVDRAFDFKSKIGISPSEIIKRLKVFYQTDFVEVCQIMIIHPITKDLLNLASKRFQIVAATNPLFPLVANETRFSQTGLDAFTWLEITSAEDYHFTKPHIEFYKELLDKIKKKPSECMIIGDDPINDMVAGGLGIKTFLVKSDHRAFSDIINTDPNYVNVDFPVNHTGTLEDLFTLLQSK